MDQISPPALRQRNKMRNRRSCAMLASLSVAVALLAVSCASSHSKETGSSSFYPAYGSGSTGLPSSATAESAQFGWPRLLTVSGKSYTVYAPQVDSWDGHRLIGRCAVAVQSPGQPQPVYGVATLNAITLVDKRARMVSLKDIHLTNGNFPSARAQTATYLHDLSQSFPKKLQGLPLDQLEASYNPPPEELMARNPKLNNTPPQIIISTKPAVLVLVDGPPAFRAVPGTKLQRVLNSRSLLLKDPSGQLFVKTATGYMTARSLGGPWTPAAKLPPGADKAEAQAVVGAESEPATQQAAAQSASPTPTRTSVAQEVFVATRPTELLVFEGQPNFTPIAGTQLLYASNTSGNVFKSLQDQRNYVLISGRWYSAPSLNGPWQYVPAHLLPSDFANIPDSSAKENVKACIPGTDQATEALIENSIPQSTSVPRATTMQNPQLDGPPQLRPIAGTPLFYVANSATPIIKVDDHSWYACQNGVWFVSTSVNGPWVVAASVPNVIYTIPPSSPMYYLTYVRVFGATPDSIYEGYTPGYLGTVVDDDGVVVYGTGYDYPPWIGDAWYGWPCTWGFGWGPCWTPWDDWCFGFGFGWGCGFGPFGWEFCHPPLPWWGPYRYWHHDGGLVAWGQGRNITTAGRVYHSPVFPARGPVRADAAPRFASSYGRAYNSRTGALVAGQHAAVRNVFDPSAPAGSPRFVSSSSRISGAGRAWRPANTFAQRSSPASRFSGYGRFAGRGFGERSGYPGAERYSGWHGEHGFSRGGGSFRGEGFSGGGWHGGGGGGGGHGGGGGGGGGGGRR